MKLFETKFYESMKSSVPLLDRITHYIVRRKGKQMRPMFVFLTAKLTGEFQERSYRAAALIELIHTATLVHDDVEIGRASCRERSVNGGGQSMMKRKERSRRKE